ncbi:MAG TPA: pyridoxal phosphate-dependent aminotransferase, partial [Bacteroidota bacterium]|nr:pyridoxal phosphate-dependent aminotransferase [Bacteroidota bacterium]
MDVHGTGAPLPDFFELRPTRAAKVSEISEATASSAIDPADRVNFHIGNPVQEERLTSAYLRAVCGLSIADESLRSDDPGAFGRALNLGEEAKPALEFYSSLISRSGPYLPRGGFSRTSPPPLAAAFADWLSHQQDPLTYDLGKTSGRREIVFASGGTAECMRVFFHAVALHLVHLPARVLLYRTSLPPHVTSFKGLECESLPRGEQEAMAAIRGLASSPRRGPAFLVLGEIMTEEARRALRGIALSYPLFFLELNDAPNHLSLARESRLTERVLRFLTPAIFSPRLRNVSIVLAAGNADYLALLETLHFQLKGTPSASEVELLTYLLRTAPPADAVERPADVRVEPPMEVPFSATGGGAALARLASRAEQTVASILAPHAGLMDALSASLEERAASLVEQTRGRASLQTVDRFRTFGAPELLGELAANIHDERWIADLQESFLRSFVRHHPEYDAARCTVISGSARTALSLLGYHCGIRDVIIPDLSWTYEHAFPAVQAVPLTPKFELDTGAILGAVRERISGDPRWPSYGAVVLNNPHNATGRVFDEAEVRELLRQLLSLGVTVIDDLSYQNVAPANDLPDIPTLRQSADALQAGGWISSAQADRLITAHSLSKTDCLAGARLSVLEIRDAELRGRFRALNATVSPNIGAILLGYLFYRNPVETARAYWRLRNAIFLERMQAIEAAQRNLPPDRNWFAISILPPAGSMYPLMIIGKLPPGLSLDWVAAGLAREGIGLVPLSTFARTGKGFDAGRKAFRLTLGGTDGAVALLNKTRRVLIDLNRVIGEEAAHYRRRQFTAGRRLAVPEAIGRLWPDVERRVLESAAATAHDAVRPLYGDEETAAAVARFTGGYVPERLEVFRTRFRDRAAIATELMAAARADNGRGLRATLERELYKDDIARREQAFRARLFDRTVHPTQMYSLGAEAAFDAVIDDLMRGVSPSPGAIGLASRELAREFLGLNVAINAAQESQEILLDLDAHISAELYGAIQGAGLPQTFLSFWGDWDGSNRPSGQGHQLAASVLLRNVERLSRLVRTLARGNTGARIDAELLGEIEKLPGNTRR